MPLNSEEALFLAEKNKNRVLLKDLGLEKAREHFARSMHQYNAKQPIFNTFDVKVSAMHNSINLRVYQPTSSTPSKPIILYLHGGGFVMGDLNAYDHDCRRLSLATECIIVSVEYRLAPEFPCPAAIEDCYAAFEWISSHAPKIGGDPNKLSIMGDSAGGNLAVQLISRLNISQKNLIKLQILLYPAIDFTCSSKSHQLFGQGYNVTSDTLAWCYDQYLNPQTNSEPLSLLDHDAKFFENFPSTLIITAEFDALRDEAEQFRAYLKKCGTQSDLKCFSGTVHGFLSYYDLFTSAKLAIDYISSHTHQITEIN
ncbi:MAG: alpha/beta hydrolase [Gammaproteobacteria bacterium]